MPFAFHTLCLFPFSCQDTFLSYNNTFLSCYNVLLSYLRHILVIQQQLLVLPRYPLVLTRYLLVLPKTPPCHPTTSSRLKYNTLMSSTTSMCCPNNTLVSYIRHCIVLQRPPCVLVRHSFAM